VSCEVLAVIAGEREQAGSSATLLGQADALRNGTGLGIPALLQRDVTGARDAALGALGPDAFFAAFERGRRAVGVGRPS
jgi:hypothetical protein